MTAMHGDDNSTPRPQRILDVRRNEALMVFSEEIQVGSLGATRVRRQRDRITLEFADGTEALIHIASYKGGMGVGEFNLSPSVIIYGGPVRRVVEALRIEIGSAFSGGKVVVALLDAVGYRRDSLAFRRTTDVPRQALRMTRAIQDGLVPLITAFTRDYMRGVEFTAREPARVLSPWCTTLTLLALSGEESAFQDVARQAETSPDRWPDLVRVNDPKAAADEIRRLAARLPQGEI